MFEFFEKKMSAAFRTFDKGFKEMEEAFEEERINSEAFLKAGKRLTKSAKDEGVDFTEQETVVEETKPDGTKIVTRTIVRTTRSK